MSTKPQIELFLENENGTQQVAYPFVESDHVSLSNGMDIDTMIRQDVSMPTVTHEDLSFKVGVGDQDVSSAIVDSSVAEMTIKGKTYQNILPEPSTHVLTNNKEMFKVNEGLDPNVEIVDGVSKSAILKGNTLVNLVNDVTSNEVGNYNNSPCKINVIRNLQNETLTIIFNVISLEIPDGADGILRIGEGWSGQIRCNPTLGVNKVLYNCNQTSNSWLGVFSNSVAYNLGQRITISDVMVLEGDYTNIDIPYFEGMQSVRMPVLTTTGKNLFNINGNVNEKYDGLGASADPNIVEGTTIIPSSMSDWHYGKGQKIKIKKGGTYTCSFTTSDGGIVDVYGSNLKTYAANKSSTFSFTASADCDEVLITFATRGGARGGKIYNFQIEEGSAATTYEPYKSNILTVNEDVTLRSNGNICDELNLLTGQLTQRIDEDGEVLSQEVIKTVDLLSSGNWEKVVLDGSEDESWFSDFTDLGDGYYRFQGNLSMLKNPYKNENNYGMGFSDSFKWSASWTGKSEGFYFDSMIVIRILGSKLPSLSIEGCMQYLQQNPLTIYYLTATHQDSTQVKQPIFFKDGHIIQSSGTDNSLIPTLDYQAKTSNSYVMDLMKTNTHYTMKAKSASGTFTIDGTSYNVGTNTTFTSPSSMTNKFLVMSNNANEEVMIIEGDVTSKTIPYFKGIKSAFEDEDKIEVLSTGKNLFDMNRRYDNITNAQATVVQNVDEITISSIESGTYVNVNFVLDKNLFKGKTVTGSCLYESDEKGIGTVQIDYQDTTGKKYYQSIKTSKTFTFPNDFIGDILLCVYANNTNTPQSNMVTVKNIQLELETKSTTYDSHKSNVSKIPLLSPLRSLPNGVCDELIIDRMKKKATLIQRVGVGVLDGTQNIKMVDSSVDTSLYQPFFCGDVFGNMAIVSRNEVVVRCDKLLANSESPSYEELTFNAIYQYPDSSARLAGQITKKDLGVKSVKDWFRANPTTIYYQLATPVVTEVDLEGFPYIYKDGHIFLNGEITPVTEIKCSINQQHQIESSSQDLIRHQKEIDYLYKLIGEYVRVDYKNTLLSLNLELK